MSGAHSSTARPASRRLAKGTSPQPSWFTYLSSTDGLYDILGVIAVTAVLLIYGVLQERIVTIGFGANKEIFNHSIFLVLCNRLVTCALAIGYLAATRASVLPAAPLQSYAAVSLTNVVATSCQYEALYYVSFAVQTLAKSAKALPVMLWGGVYNAKKYRPADYVHALVITLGCSLFLMTGKVASRTVDNKDTASYVIGSGLMLLYLAVDGLTSTWQDAMFCGYHVGVCDQVLYTTACSTLLSLFGALAAHQFVPACAFVLRNPEALWWILALSVISAAVQLVISWTIKRYGAVVFATIMTTRQFFSILLSSLIFRTPLSLGQWGGSLLVFGALYYKAMKRISPGAAGNARHEAHSERAVGKADDDLKLPLLEKDKRSEVVLARVLLEKDRDRNLDKDRDSNSELPHPDRERERDLERDRGSRLLWDTRRASAGAPTVLSAREADA